MNTKTSTVNKNLYNTWVDSQKKLIDTVTESTQKLAGNELVGETIEKGSEIYKNWLDTQLTFINKQTSKLQDSPTDALNPENVTETAKNWMKNQMEVNKEFMDFSMNTMKELVQSVVKANPALNGNGEKITLGFNQNLDAFKKWNDTLTKNYEQMVASFDNKTVKNVMQGMSIQNDVYNKFVEMWSPVIKAMQNNTFTPESLSAFINPSAYKEFMDKVMGLNKDMMSNLSSAFNTTGTPWNEWMNQMETINKNMMNMMNSTNNGGDLMKNWMNMFNTQNNPMMNNDMMKNWMNLFNTASQWNDMTKNFQNMFNMGSNPMLNNDMMKNFQSMFTTSSNPMLNNDMMKNWMNMYNNTAQWTEMTKNFQNMFNIGNNPMMNNELMKNFQNMFSGNNSDMMKNWTNMLNMQNNPMADMMKKMMEMNGMNNMNPMISMFQNNDVFGNMMSTYNNMFTSAQQMFGPMFRMMTPGATKDHIELMTSVFNKWNQYNIKNTAMQYLTYTAGVKAMNKIAEEMQEKISKGEDFKGMNAFYTAWLNTSDKVFVDLFESDEFSKVQAEVAALSHGLKKEVAELMEKMMANIPVITRTEMDDTYKTLYDLNKRVKDIERNEKNAASKTVAHAAPVAKPVAAKTIAKKTVAKKK